MHSLLWIIGLDADIGDKIVEHFASSPYKISFIRRQDSLLYQLREIRPDLIIVGKRRMNTDNRLSLVRSIREHDPQIPIILISDQGDEADAVAAFRAGVKDYFTVPVPFQQMVKTIEDLVAPCLVSSITHTSSYGAMKLHSPTMIGQCPAMRSTFDTINRVAGTDSTVLITGETGTGKELTAELIHFQSRRTNKPMVAVNCAALPESLAESELFGYERGAFTGAVTEQKGKFTLANGGTIFLDEIGDMNPSIQAKILHVLERKEVYPLGCRKSTPLDVRIIAATNQEPESLLLNGRFREDLYYRLNIARIQLPPLRERIEDIPALVDFGINKLNKRFNRQVSGLTPDAMAFLQSYAWPGNVRELMNLLEATFIHLPYDSIGLADFPPHFRNMLAATKGRTEEERRALISTLLKTNWNKSRAAQELKWSRMTLYRKMLKYNIVENRSVQPSL